MTLTWTRLLSVACTPSRDPALELCDTYAPGTQEGLGLVALKCRSKRQLQVPSLCLCLPLRQSPLGLHMLGPPGLHLALLGQPCPKSQFLLCLLWRRMLHHSHHLGIQEASTVHPSRHFRV